MYFFEGGVSTDRGRSIGLNWHRLTLTIRLTSDRINRMGFQSRDLVFYVFPFEGKWDYRSHHWTGLDSGTRFELPTVVSYALNSRKAFEKANLDVHSTIERSRTPRDHCSFIVFLDPVAPGSGLPNTPGCTCVISRSSDRNFLKPDFELFYCSFMVT